MPQFFSDSFTKPLYAISILLYALHSQAITHTLVYSINLFIFGTETLNKYYIDITKYLSLTKFSL